MFKIEEMFTVRIVYDSGYTHDFETTDFNTSTGPRASVTWGRTNATNFPVKIGVDNIIAVWQVGRRRRIRFTLFDRKS